MRGESISYASVFKNWGGFLEMLLPGFIVVTALEDINFT